MARPIKNGLDYFSHDTDASSDEKIEILRSLHGNDGYAFYFITLERCYRSGEFQLDLSSDSAIKIHAKKVGVTTKKLLKMIQTSVNFKIFDPNFWEFQKILKNSGMTKRANVLIQKRLRMQEHYKSKVVSTAETEQNNAETIAETTQSKVKESKVKESKEYIERDAQALSPTVQAQMLPATQKPKTSTFKPDLITREQYQAMLNDPKLAAGDREYLKLQVQTMADWSASGSKRKTDWAATLRNWIRRSRENGQMPSGIAKTNGPKCFAQLEQEWGDNQLAEFLKRQKEKVIQHVEN